MHGVQQSKRLDRTVPEVTAIALKRHTAAHVHIPQVHRRMAVQNPVGEHLARATGGLDADGVEARSDVQVTHFGRLAEQVTVIRCETLRPVEEQVDAGSGQRGRAMHCRGEQGLDVIKVIGQLVEAESLSNPAHAPGLGNGLEPTDQQLAGVFLEVGATVRVTQYRQVRRQACHRLRDDVEMLGRVQGHGRAGTHAEFVRPHSGAVDHDVGTQLTLRCTHAHGATAFDDDRVY